MYKKFNNKVVVKKDGKFDSKKEYTIWLKLKRQEEMGLIKNLKRQVPFVLIPKQYIYENGKKKLVERECKYIADYVWTDCKTNKKVVADCKGIETETFKIKKKLMLFVHKIEIKIIK